VLDTEAISAARAMGMPESEIARVKAEAKEAAKRDVLQVWPENWRPLLLTMNMMTQIRYGFSGAYGFDYTAIPVVEARLGLPPVDDPREQAEDFAAFREIEKIVFDR